MIYIKSLKRIFKKHDILVFMRKYLKEIVIFLVLVAAFEVVFILNPASPGVILKIAPSVVLASLIFRIKGVDRGFMLVALIFCVAGDVFLHLDRERFFLGGLISFALGHLVYTIYFFKTSSKKGRGFIVPGLIVLYGIGVGVLLRGIGDMQSPVWVYLAIIILMTIGSYYSKLYSLVLISGTSLFVFSDTVLAINKFIMFIPYATPINIFLYFIAQLLIVLGVVKVLEHRS